MYTIIISLYILGFTYYVKFQKKIPFRQCCGRKEQQLNYFQRNKNGLVKGMYFKAFNLKLSFQNIFNLQNVHK